MPLMKIQFKPGVNRETTSYGNEGQWFNSDLIRFRKGRPEKMGGWTKLSTSTIIGTGRSLHVWAALDGSKYMGVGTEKKFYIEEGGIYNDATPIRSTDALGANPIVTGSSGSGVVTINDTNHGARTGDYVTISGATTTDGITAAQLNLEFELTVVNSNSFTITTAGSASSGSTAGGGSSVVATYQISAGLGVVVPGTGWGAGLWGGSLESASETTLDGSINDSVTSFALTSATDFEVASSSLSSSITDVSTALYLADASDFPSKGTVLIGSEKIEYGNKSGNVLSDLTRGADGTTAAAASGSASVTFVGLVQIEQELIQYTGKSTNNINAGVVRGARGTTAASHSDDVAVKEANAFVGWGEASNITTSEGSNIRLWSQDNWGEDLVFCAYDGAPYYWDKTLGTSARATTLATQSGASNPPTVARRIMVSGTARHLIAFGCNAQGETDQDLLLVRWSDRENPFDWTLSSTNKARFQRISSGSEIISAQKTRQEILVWTDVNLHAMRFVGGDDVFGFSLLASNISILGPNASIAIADRIFWMDRENFYMYAGSVQTLPCTVLRYVFDDINLSQSHKFFAAANKMFDEVLWFYASASSSEIDRYAKFNMSEGVWDIGTLARTAWVDYGIHDNPRAFGSADSVNYVYIQESGDNADGSAMTSYIESSDFDLGDGEQFMFINRLIPDISITDTSAGSSGTVDYVLKTRNYPGDSLTTNSTNSVSSTTQQAFLRGRSRQAVLRIQSSVSDLAWTLGDLRLEMRPDGRR
jgi:hypothetical protein